MINLTKAKEEKNTTQIVAVTSRRSCGEWHLLVDSTIRSPHTDTDVMHGIDRCHLHTDQTHSTLRLYSLLVVDGLVVVDD